VFPEQFKKKANFKELDLVHTIDPQVYDVEGAKPGPVEGF
jgi:hypothetical protein